MNIAVHLKAGVQPWQEKHVCGHTMAVTLCLFTPFFIFIHLFLYECMEFSSSVDMI